MKKKVHTSDLSIRLRKAFIRYEARFKCMAVYGPIRIIDPNLRRPTLVPFIPDISNPINHIDAVRNRYAVDMPVPDPDVARDFYEYAKEFIRTVWKDTLRDEDVRTFVDWLDSSNYPGSRKKDLEKLMTNIERMDKKFSLVEMFIKWEGYMEPKYARAINSPSDESKCILGRLFKAIDKKTFGARFFVKGTNPRDWPSKLYEALGSRPVTETDFTAFESHHRGVFSKVVYFWYLHMIRNLSGIRPMKDLIARLMLGRNTIESKYLKVGVDNRLMSGSLWTSSANGVLNLIIMSFLASKPHGSPKARAEWAAQHFTGFVEGDDGLCLDYGIQKEDIVKLGCVLDMEPHSNFTQAKFCGIVCDERELVVIKDPIAALTKLFALPPRYQDSKDTVHKSLLRARALSYLCNFSHTPVLASACHWILRRTKGYNIDQHQAVLGEVAYDWAKIAESELKSTRWEKSKIADGTRLVAEERFGISVGEQLYYESLFDNCDSDLCPINFGDHVSDVMFSHGERYLYHVGEEPQMRSQVLSDEVISIATRGLDPVSKSRFCSRITREFDGIVHPLDLGFESLPLNLGQG